MGSRSADKIKFTSFDELFGEPGAGEIKNKAGTGKRENENGETDREIRVPLEKLHSFKDHPFHVVEDQEMMEMVESVRQFGVLVPAIVRPDKRGGYEIIAGHRRKRASELAGCQDIPVIVRNMTDDESVIAMVDSNIQRQNILPSEKAWAYRMKMEAMAHQGVKGESHTAAALGEASGDSARTVHRYIRLTFLVPGLMERVDQKRLPVVVGESLSFLREGEQELVKDYIARNQVFPSKEEAEMMRMESGKGDLTEEKVQEIMRRNVKVSGITIPAKRIREYFPADYTKEQMEEIVYGLLDSWRAREEG